MIKLNAKPAFFINSVLRFVKDFSCAAFRFQSSLWHPDYRPPAIVEKVVLSFDTKRMYCG